MACNQQTNSAPNQLQLPFGMAKSLLSFRSHNLLFGFVLVFIHLGNKDWEWHLNSHHALSHVSTNKFKTMFCFNKNDERHVHCFIFILVYATCILGFLPICSAVFRASSSSLGGISNWGSAAWRSNAPHSIKTLLYFTLLQTKKKATLFSPT